MCAPVSPIEVGDRITTFPTRRRTSGRGSPRRVADSADMTAAPTDAPVLLDLADGVATITLNRPQAMNSLDIATKELLL